MAPQPSHRCRLSQNSSPPSQSLAWPGFLVSSKKTMARHSVGPMRGGPRACGGRAGTPGKKKGTRRVPRSRTASSAGPEGADENGRPAGGREPLPIPHRLGRQHLFSRGKRAESILLADRSRPVGGVLGGPLGLGHNGLKLVVIQEPPQARIAGRDAHGPPTGNPIPGGCPSSPGAAVPWPPCSGVTKALIGPAGRGGTAVGHAGRLADKGPSPHTREDVHVCCTAA